MFRTATGQTGRDAYIFEATAIANAQRALDERFHRLVEVIHEEAPEMFTGKTDYWFSGGTEARSFSEYLKGPKHYVEWLKEGGHVRR